MKENMMKYKMKTLLCAVLIFAVLFGAVYMPASSYANDVETSTNDMILINVDTNTIVFSQRADNKWFCGYLVTLIDYLVACDVISDPEGTSFAVEKDFIDALPHSDGCLTPYIGKTLTAKDLMAISLISSGNDAAYALVKLSGMSEEAFVAAMNAKAVELGCNGTSFLSPGYSNDRSQHTTCRDLYRIYMAVRKTKLYDELTGDKSYVPAHMEPSAYTTNSNASILNSSSPYYFRYTNDAKYSYTKETYENIALTTTYQGQTYFFAGMLGYHLSEQNVYADARKLTTWAYLNLKDRKVIDSEAEMSPVTISTKWGSYEVQLHPFNSAYKTLPEDFDETLLSYHINAEETYTWPLFAGHRIGTAEVTYDKEKIEDVDLVLDSNEGVDMLSDSARFGNYVLDRLLSKKPDAARGTAVSKNTVQGKSTADSGKPAETVQEG